ncbi:MAG: 4Fe-4S dicluster domain-containing protein [bacterium]
MSESINDETRNGEQWGMVIDLDRCTGCKACEVACMAENNLPITGEQAVKEGNEQKWIRVERYQYGEFPDVNLEFLPMLCQQCEEAPCEPVCPVYATYHSEEAGHLNVQVYNRCVGTRYCANNCPYNVRYFNWTEATWPEPLDEQLNPDVTVRDSGVMEKCTFCIQRIDRAQDRAEDEGRQVQDGEVNPACVLACPPDAMVFGDLNDPDSQVSKMADSDREYRVFEEKGTRPSVHYLKSLTDEMRPAFDAAFQSAMEDGE